jgi:hypothetical protein
MRTHEDRMDVIPMLFDLHLNNTPKTIMKKEKKKKNRAKRKGSQNHNTARRLLFSLSFSYARRNNKVER